MVVCHLHLDHLLISFSAGLDLSNVSRTLSMDVQNKMKNKKYQTVGTIPNQT